MGRREQRQHQQEQQQQQQQILQEQQRQRQVAPASTATATANLAAPQWERMQAALESSLATYTTARVDLQTAMDTLMVFKDRTESRIADIENALVSTDPNAVRAGPAPAMLPSAASRDMEDLKSSMSQLK